jgi:hypothetical protein
MAPAQYKDQIERLATGNSGALTEEPTPSSDTTEPESSKE